MSFNVVLYMEAIRQVRDRSRWTISWKKKRGKKYMYKQYNKNKKRNEEYVRRRDEDTVQAEFDEKQNWIRLKKQLAGELKALPPAERREAHQQMKLYEELDLASLPEDKDVAIDGTVMDSREEIIAYDLALQANIHPEHDVMLDPDYFYSKRVDFVFEQNGKTFYWEHMGMLSDSAYHSNQIRKIKEYARREDPIRLSDNLIITAPYKGKIQVPRMVWRLVRAGVIPARKARRMCR